MGPRQQHTNRGIKREKILSCLIQEGAAEVWCALLDNHKELDMKHVKTLVFVFALACLGAALAPQARADEWNRKTIMTFSAPVELPGVVLPAGTYVFKLADSSSDRDIVQVFNKEENHLYGTILAIPDYRVEPTDKTVVTFSERPAGSPEAIKTWFYPGDTDGYEFVYPKREAMELAKANKQPVPSMPTMMAKSGSKPAQPAEIQAMKEAPLSAIQPSGKEVQLAQAAPLPAPAQNNSAPAKMARTTITRLPKTASSLPLFLLIGTTSLAFSLTLRLVSKQTS